MSVDYQDILSFWFANPKMWFAKDQHFDQQIIDKFETTYEQAIAGKLEHWQEDPKSTVALIILIDQFPRNMFRDQAKTYQADLMAVSLAKLSIEKGFDEQLSNIDYQKFMYMPLMHSENLKDQELSVECFNKIGEENTLAYAVDHKNVVDKYGRFPHRNSILNRASTKDELEYLQSPNVGY